MALDRPAGSFVPVIELLEHFIKLGIHTQPPPGHSATEWVAEADILMSLLISSCLCLFQTDRDGVTLEPAHPSSNCWAGRGGSGARIGHIYAEVVNLIDV
jgi:hypothetical protein